MYEVKRAVIPAAGLGNRMRPLTLEIPKPLVPVNGTPMIETVINALHENDIQEIYVVVGHLGEQFLYLEDKYPGLHILKNPYFESCNNISSLYVARQHLEDSIILDGDQLVRNSSALSRGFERSGYNCVWTDEMTDEWLLTAENGLVAKCSRTGGSHGWQLFSVSRWTAEDGRKLRRHLELEFDVNNNRQIYWDDIAMFCHSDEYELGIRPMDAGDVIEIDSLPELAAIDSSYLKYIEKEGSL